MIINNISDNPQFYGRRKGRKLSKSSKLAIRNGKDYLIREEDIFNIFHRQNNIVLEIGFGDGENLINSAKMNPYCFYIGADPFLNTTAKCLSKIIQYNLIFIKVCFPSKPSLFKEFGSFSFPRLFYGPQGTWVKIWNRHKNI